MMKIEKLESILFFMLGVTLLVTFGDVRGDVINSSVVAENAFAVLGFETVRGGRLYTPFYDYVITPHAVVANDDVYCSFQDPKGRPVVMVYDIEQKKWAGPIRASEFGLGRDAHGNPSICIDRKGYIHIFYGCHGRAMRYARSAKDYDISNWEEQPSPTPRSTYPQSMLLAGGKICLFYRAGGHMEPWSMRISSDVGKTWSEAEKIIEMRLEPRDPLAAAYCDFFPGSDDRTIHCFWLHKDDNAARIRGEKKHPWRPLKYKGLHEAVYRYNVYYVYWDAQGIWRNAAGEKVKLPISKAYADRHCLVYDSGDEFTSLRRIAVDNRNRPYIKFGEGVGDWTKGLNDPRVVIVPWKDRYAHYDKGMWKIRDKMPESWPAEVVAVVSARGVEAYGDRSKGRWYIFRTSRPLVSGAGSSIFLYSERSGYAVRKGGAAKVE